MRHPLTELLYLSQPRRATALAKVTHAARAEVALDRTIFAPRSLDLMHPAPADGGTVWVGGDKRVLERVHWRDGRLWHRLRGVVPPVGAPLRLEADAPARLAAERAHTAMHLMLAALPQQVHVSPPEVRGGGRFRLTVRDAPAPDRLAEALRQANAWVREDHAVRIAPWPADAAQRLALPQRFDPPRPMPGHDGVVWCADVEGVGLLPCDGRHCARTGQVGRVRIEAVRPAKGATLVLGVAG